MLLATVQLLGGLVVLTLGGHYIVKGAISIALLARISTSVVGLTVVAFGTSLPELAVSLRAATTGHTDISYANVVGSNVFNIAAILGVVALFWPVAVSRGALRLQYPGMLAVLIAGVIVARGGIVTHVEGAFLVAGLVAFMAGTVYLARSGRGAAGGETAAELPETGPAGGVPPSWGAGIAHTVIGILGLWVGASLMVDSAIVVAASLGVTERVIGLTVIAMGTSLPELAATLAASRHGDSKIVLGNILGSNIFNVLGILGLTSLIIPVPVHPRAASLDNWVMLAFAVALFPMMLIGRKVTRTDAAILLTGFALYVAVLVAG